MDLTNMIIVELTPTKVTDVPDLREFEQDFGNGVRALWSDEEQGIIAFAFPEGQWTQAEAEAWVKATKNGDVKAEGESMPYKSMKEVNPALKGIEPPLTLGQANEIAAMADAIAAGDNPPKAPWGVAIASFKKRYEVKGGKWVKKEADREGSREDTGASSFDERRRMVDKALAEKFGVNDSAVPSVAVWVMEMNEDAVIYFYNGKHYTAPYTIKDGVAEIGEPVEVTQGWKTTTGIPVMLHAFDSHLTDGLAAQDAPDGYVWKEVIKPGAWFKMDSGRKVEVTSDIIKEAVRAFEAGLPKFVSVPADSHHAETHGVVPAESNRGFCPRLKQIDDSLYAAFKITDPQIAAGVQDGSIADCSVYLQPDVVHPQTGEKFPWVLRHVLLTNNPLVQDLKPFGDIPASGEDGVTIIHYRQAPGEEHMPEKKTVELSEAGAMKLTANADEIILSGDSAREYAALVGLGLSAESIKALVEQRAAIEAQAAELRGKARDIEVSSIVRALEGKDTHKGVTAIANRVHYPVVINAVEKALREAPAALALDADDDGVSKADEMVLAIVNAIPEEARIKLDASDGTKQPPAPPAKKDTVTDEQVDTFLNTIS